MEKRDVFWGGILVLTGTILLLNNFFELRIFYNMNFLPFFVLGLGLAFEASYFISYTKVGYLIPGGIFSTIGILLFYGMFTDWKGFDIKTTWPVYPLSFSIGLFQYYHFGLRRKGVLTFAWILSVIAIVFLLNNIFKFVTIYTIVPILLVILGIRILVKTILNKTSK